MAIGKDCLELEKKIGYKFQDIKLLETALTHSSYANEKRSQGMNFSSNERLEFLGDAVLEIIVSEYLYSNHKNRSEGMLTKMRQYLVCEKTLAKISAELGIGEYINLGRGEELTDCRRRPKVLADAFEAILGAMYLDSQIENTDYKSTVLSLLSSEIDNASSMQKGDYKTLLQQLVEKDGSSILEYQIEDEDGPEHDKTFTVLAKINNNIVGKGVSKSKKDAQMKAAKMALELFGVSV